MARITRLSFLFAGVWLACATSESEATPPPSGEDAGTQSRDGGGQVGKDDASGPDEKKDEEDAAPTPLEAKKRIFATHDQWTGNLGGLAGADAKCVAAAGAANLGGSWKAWISDSTDEAAKRVAKVGPWKLVDGTVVFTSQVIAGTPVHDLDMDEFGETGIKGQVWTGSSPTGTSTGSDCNDWTSTGADATVGLAQDPDKWAQESNGTPCSLKGRLYCVEQ